MKVTKLGHCCLVIEEAGVKIMTDPGAFSLDDGQLTVTDLDVVLITHEHQDHLHIASIKTILKNNSSVEIITNSAVGKILTSEGIKFTLLEDGTKIDYKGISLEGFGTTHAEIYENYGQVLNTGFLIGG